MKFFSKRRGISTAVETALMLSAVAILGSTIVMWSNSSVSSYETKLASTSTGNANKFNEFLSIENVWFCKTTCSHGIIAPGVNVTLTNVGTIGLNVTQIQLNSTTPSSVRIGGLLPGASYLWGLSSWNWHSKSAQTITVTTGRGTIFTTRVSPP